MKKQTAVEWLIKEYSRFIDDSNVPFGVFEQAKEMEKEQIYKAHYQGQSDEKDYWEIGDKCMSRFSFNSIKYYDETYGGNK